MSEKRRSLLRNVWNISLTVGGPLLFTGIVGSALYWEVRSREDTMRQIVQKAYIIASGGDGIFTQSEIETFLEGVDVPVKMRVDQLTMEAGPYSVTLRGTSHGRSFYLGNVTRGTLEQYIERHIKRE